MSDGTFDGRPSRIPGDPKLILELIARYEAHAEDRTDEGLEADLEVAKAECLRLFPKIGDAQRDYQTPSQAFYVFDRILNRRRLNALRPI